MRGDSPGTFAPPPSLISKVLLASCWNRFEAAAEAANRVSAERVVESFMANCSIL